MAAPTATAVSPASGEILLAETIPIIIDIVEPVDGVNTATIVVSVENVTAYSGNSFQNSWTGSLLARPQGGYRLVLNSPTPFPQASQIDVKVDASSNINDAMPQYVYAFFVQIKQITFTEDVTVPRIVDTGPYLLSGTSSVTQSSPNVVGTATSYLTQLIVGDMVRFGNDASVYFVQGIADNTHLTLTTNYTGTTNPSVQCRRIFLWIGYSREPGNIIVRKTLGTGLMAETIVVPGNDLSMSFDPNLNKFLLTYVHNGKVFLTTADVTDLPATLLQTDILRNDAKMPLPGDCPVPPDGIPGIATFTPIKLVTPIDSSVWNYVGNMEFPVQSDYPTFPGMTFKNFPYATSTMSAVPNLPGNPATWRIVAPTGIDASYKYGYNIIKFVAGVFSPPTFVPFSSLIPEYTEFNETAAPLLQTDAYYCLQDVIRDTTGNIRAGAYHGFYKHPLPPAFGVPETIALTTVGFGIGSAEMHDNIPLIVTFPPIKLVTPPDSSVWNYVGDNSAYFTLQTTGYGNIGVG